jgi:hypothetical protein
MHRPETEVEGEVKALCNKPELIGEILKPFCAYC